MNRLPLLLAACVSFGSTTAESICLPIVCGPPPPTLWVWGNENPSCPTTLQDCIDGAAPGDVVEIATNFPIGDSVTISKSLTLDAAPGFAPVFVNAGIFASTPTTGDGSIAIENISMQPGSITVVQQSTGTLDVRITGNTIELPFSDEGEGAIFLEESQSTIGALTFEISGNTISVPGAGEFAISAEFESNSSSGRIANNSISMGEGSGAIVLNSLGGGSIDVDVIANRISGPGYNDGILISQVMGTAQARIADNLVTGERPQGGQVGAITLDAGAGTLAATVVDNTLADDDLAIADLRESGGGTLTGVVANNIIAGSAEHGLFLPAGTLSNASNVVFDDAGNSFTPGPGTVTADPLFVDAAFGDYHLKPGSPAIDAGDDGSVPADLTTDLDGSARIQGRHVDIGAYETAPEPGGALGPVVSLSALGALAGLRIERREEARR